ncbi:MAG: hypothetical protein WDM88_04815 [Galbitalea sp.]
MSRKWREHDNSPAPFGAHARRAHDRRPRARRGVRSGPRASNAPTASASPTRTAPATTSPTTKPTPAASPSAPPAASWTPVSVACSSVLTAQQVYGYNPNYVANGAYTPAAGSSAATMKSNHGVACGWINETSGSPIAISIAQPDATTLGGLKKTAASGGAAMALNNGAAGTLPRTAGSAPRRYSRPRCGSRFRPPTSPRRGT